MNLYDVQGFISAVTGMAQDVNTGMAKGAVKRAMKIIYTRDDQHSQKSALSRTGAELLFPPSWGRGVKAPRKFTMATRQVFIFRPSWTIIK